MVQKPFKVEQSIEVKDSDGSLLRIHHDGAMETTTSRETKSVSKTSEMINKEQAIAIAIVLGT